MPFNTLSPSSFKTKYKVDILSSPKATFRLAVGCERLKKIISANSEAPLNVEFLMNDINTSSKLSRDAYEELIASVFDRNAVPLQQALAESGLSVDHIDAVELVGGTTRIPVVRARIQLMHPRPHRARTSAGMTTTTTV